MTELISPTLAAGLGNSGSNINRDIEQIVSNIDRQDTPMYSMVGDRKVKNTIHEWQTDTYKDAAFQAYNENYQYAAGDVELEARKVLNNQTQIFVAPYGVSDTAIAVDTAGVANEFNYQGIKEGVFLKRNVERQILSNPATGAVNASLKNASQGSDAKTGGRRFGSVFSFAGSSTANGAVETTNTGANNANAAVGGGGDFRADGTSILLGGTDANLTRATVSAHLAGMYSKGARPSVAMMSPLMKVNYSKALYADGTNGGIVQRIDAKDSSINTAIDMVSTDFGFNLKLVPNWLYNNASGTGNTDPSTILFFDPSMVKMGTLRPMSTKRDLAQSGDGMRGLVRCEKTLIVQNPDAVGAMYGVRETNT